MGFKDHQDRLVLRGFQGHQDCQEKMDEMVLQGHLDPVVFKDRQDMMDMTGREELQERMGKQGPKGHRGGIEASVASLEGLNLGPLYLKMYAQIIVVVLMKCVLM